MPDHFTDENEGEPVAWRRMNMQGTQSTAVTDVTYYRDMWLAEGSVVQPLYAHPDPAVERLQRELHTMQTAGIIEVAVRNSNVAEYMNHWEARAIAAEASLVKAREALKPFFHFEEHIGLPDDVPVAVEHKNMLDLTFTLGDFRSLHQAARAILGDQP